MRASKLPPRRGCRSEHFRSSAVGTWKVCLPTTNRWIKGGLAMNVSEEIIDATLHSNGQLQLTHPPRLPPAPCG